MTHDIAIDGSNARCSCGYTAVCLSPEFAKRWGSEHLSEFGFPVSQHDRIATGDHRFRDVPFAADAERLKSATDDQLRAEVVRRNIGVPISSSRFSIQELQSEAEARGVKAWFSDDELRAECERRFAGPVNEYTRLADEHHKTTAERDEWKRRAEAAEAKASEVQRVADFWADKSIAIQRDREREHGPGLAALDTRPDNSIAHLPEDLLCEDA